MVGLPRSGSGPAREAENERKTASSSSLSHTIRPEEAGHQTMVAPSSAIASTNTIISTSITLCARTAFLLFMLPFSSAFSSSPVKLLHRCRPHISRAVAGTALPRRPRVHPRRPLRLMDRDGSVFAIRTARLCSASDAMATSGAPHAGPSASEDGVDGSEAKADEEGVDIDRLMGEEVAEEEGARSAYRQEYEELSTSGRIWGRCSCRRAPSSRTHEANRDLGFSSWWDRGSCCGRRRVDRRGELRHNPRVSARSGGRDLAADRFGARGRRRAATNVM